MPTAKVSDRDRFLAWAATAPTDEVRTAISSAAAILRKRSPLRRKQKPNSQENHRSEQVMERPTQ